VISPYVERIVSHYEKQKTEAKGSITRFIVAIGPFYYDSRRCGLCHKTEKEVGHNLLSCAEDVMGWSSTAPRNIKSRTG
jgi:hypothetical protein